MCFLLLDKLILWNKVNNQFSSVQLLSRVWLLATPWIAAREASLSITNSQSQQYSTPNVERIKWLRRPSAYQMLGIECKFHTQLSTVFQLQYSKIQFHLRTWNQRKTNHFRLLAPFYSVRTTWHIQAVDLLALRWRHRNAFSHLEDWLEKGHFISLSFLRTHLSSSSYKFLLGRDCSHTNMGDARVLISAIQWFWPVVSISTGFNALIKLFHLLGFEIAQLEFYHLH